MKPSLRFCIVLCLLAACHRKTVPVKETYTPPPRRTETRRPEPPAPIENRSSVVVPDNKPAAATVVINNPLIVIDGLGRVVTAKDKLPPDQAARVDYDRLERAYTTEQKNNLIRRYNILPPRTLYVPDKYVTKSLKGDYIIYKSKFWYWRKPDGLFHLEETYYK